MSDHDVQLLWVEANGRTNLEMALRLAFGQQGQPVIRYITRAAECLTLWGHAPEGMKPMPKSLSVEDVFDLVAGWLTVDAEYPEDDGGDGSYVAGFRVRAGGDHRMPDEFVETDWEVICHIEPCWLYYGK